jgi:hypothetical protein
VEVKLPLRVLLPAERARVEPEPLIVMFEVVAIWLPTDRETAPPLIERSPGIATMEVPLALALLSVNVFWLT